MEETAIRFGASPALWFSLLLLPLLIAFLWWGWRARQRLAAQFVQARLLAQLTVGVSRTRQKVRLALLVAAVACLMFALARPQWGFEWEEAKQRGLDVVVAIDTSRSMLAQDVRPNRLTRARLAALDLMQKARSDRLGLVAFAGTAFLQCPLTLDDSAFRQSVEALDTSIIPQGGTALAEAIQTALTAFKDSGDNHKVLVLFTDGEDHDSGALAAAESAAKEGMRIFTIGVGTPDGELLRTMDAKGRTEFIKDDQGNAIKSRLNESLLQQIAQATHGFYLPLRGADTVNLLYERGLAPLPKSDLNAKLVKRYHERFYWPVGLAIVLLLLEMFLPELMRAQRPGEVSATTNPQMRKAIAALLVLFLPLDGGASPSRALRDYQNGKYRDAAKEFERLLEKKPNDSRLLFNAGAAAYQAGKFEAAAKRLAASLVSPDVQLQQRAYYNLGNAHFRLGEQAGEANEKVEAWEQAIKDYKSALELDLQDSDAKFNKELVEKKLEELKKQQQQKSGGSKNDSQQDQSKQDQKPPPPDQKSEDKNQEKKEQQQNADSQKQQQQQQAQNDQQKDQQKEQSQSASSRQQKNSGGETNQAGVAAYAARMTPQEAMQLLEALKGEEKALIFIPQDQKRTNTHGRVFKDW